MSKNQDQPQTLWRDLVKAEHPQKDDRHITVWGKEGSVLIWQRPVPAPGCACEGLRPDARIIELAERLCLPGGKADHVSASEMMEITDWIFSLQDAAPCTGQPKECACEGLREDLWARVHASSTSFMPENAANAAVAAFDAKFAAPCTGQPGSRDWPEDAPHENGNYGNTCTICGCGFIGHKRRVVCKLCTGQPGNEILARIQAHRACHSAEHDPANGKIHGYCVVCGVPFPCEYVGQPGKTAQEWAIGRAAQAWCTKANENTVMDTDLALAFADILLEEVADRDRWKARAEKAERLLSDKDKTRDPMEVLSARLYEQCMSQREEVLKAFIAEYGCKPSEAIQCVRQFGEWFVRRMSPEEIAFRDKVHDLAQPPSQGWIPLDGPGGRKPTEADADENGRVTVNWGKGNLAWWPWRSLIDGTNEKPPYWHPLPKLTPAPDPDAVWHVAGCCIDLSPGHCVNVQDEDVAESIVREHNAALAHARKEAK